MEKEKILIIVGPTAVGKTALSIKLAKKFNGEIINGDSMQVYEQLDIGTAKIKEEEKQGIPHHLIDILKPDQTYSASDFKHQAQEKIKEIGSRNKLPIIVGGTGLYIESLIYNVSHGGQSKKNPTFRQKLKKQADRYGSTYLFQKLKEKDPKAAENIHPNNTQRLIRALEVIQESGQLFSSFQNERKNAPALYDCLIICLDTDRQLLYQRINQRVDDMLEQGLLEEVQVLQNQYGQNAPSAKAIGYKEFFPYLNGELSFDQAVEAVKKNSRRYAKRQLTWFRNRTPVDLWVNLLEQAEDINKINQAIEEFLANES